MAHQTQDYIGYSNYISLWKHSINSSSEGACLRFSAVAPMHSGHSSYRNPQEPRPSSPLDLHEWNALRPEKPRADTSLYLSKLKNFQSWYLLQLASECLFCSYWRESGIPCICPIISSLSNRSVPASRSSFPPLAFRNFLLKSRNQPSQKGCVAVRSVCHVHGRESVPGDWGRRSWRRSEGTEIRAELRLRMVWDRMLRWTLSRKGG